MKPAVTPKATTRGYAGSRWAAVWMFNPREAVPPEAADAVLSFFVLLSADCGGEVTGVAVLVDSTTVKGIRSGLARSSFVVILT